MRRFLTIVVLVACGLVVLVWLWPDRADVQDLPVVITPGGTASVEYADPATATVDRVVDGDTLDVVLDGRLTRIRLLNIDTPETVKPDAPVECAGPEASAYLESLLPPGSQVTLEFDRERLDQYDRTLAAVITARGENASVLIAAAGLGEAVLFESNDRFYADVVTAAEQAESEGRGFWGELCP